MNILYEPATGKITGYICEQDDDWREVKIKNLELRIAELEATLRELLNTFNPEPRMDDIGLIWGRAAAALKGNI